jgi:hypothetical protein
MSISINKTAPEYFEKFIFNGLKNIFKNNDLQLEPIRSFINFSYSTILATKDLSVVGLRPIYQIIAMNLGVKLLKQNIKLNQITATQIFDLFFEIREEIELFSNVYGSNLTIPNTEDLIYIQIPSENVNARPVIMEFLKRRTTSNVSSLYWDKTGKL